MNDLPPTVPPRAFDGARFTLHMSQIAQEWQELLRLLPGPQSADRSVGEEARNLSQFFAGIGVQLAADPLRLVDLQMDYCRRMWDVWEQETRRFFGDDSLPPSPELPKTDKRFADPAWSESAWFETIRRTYLASAGWLEDFSREAGALQPESAKRLDFYTRQFIDAMAPSNFLLTNPAALKATIESDGENLLQGFRHLKEDLLASQGRLQIKMTDTDAFRIGESIAASAGEVVFRNDLMELLQYSPTTAKAHRTPLLLIPAWINKFYIFDMQESNSFVRWLTGEGYTVFVVSWVNPDDSHSEKSFESYLMEGPLAAFEVIEAITGERGISVIGYCLGGTLLSIALAWLEAKGEADRVKSATFLTTMIDFSEPGELGVFIDEDQVSALEGRMSAKGYLEGSEMAATFNMLRSNDLIWSFVVNHYLLGKEPFPFDLLYWNADSTRMPARMHSFYLRNMYLTNKLRQKGGVTLGGVSIDLSTIKTPVYLLSTRDDHIAPWRSTFASTGIYGGDITFTLAASGHIAGVINPPVKKKYGFWTNPSHHETPDEWLAHAEEKSGSWWPHWNEWQKKFRGGKVAARLVAPSRLGAAPGSYVQVR